MKVLVLGANGMLGRAMMETWSDHAVVGLDLPDLDITRPPEIARKFELYQPQLVVNCAAYTAVDQCESDEAEADLVNGTAVGYVAKACDVRKVPLIHISTDYVFDGQRSAGYAEDAQPAPINAYGRTKEHGERQLWLNTKRAWLVRTSWLYGPNGPSSGSGQAKNFVTTMIELGRSKPELKIVNDQHGKPTSTRDLAEFTKSLVTDRAAYGVYHGINEQETTWYEFALEIFRLARIFTPVHPCTSAEFPRPAKRPTWSTLLNTKRPPLRPWPEALRDYLLELGYTVA